MSGAPALTDAVAKPASVGSGSAPLVGSDVNPPSLANPPTISSAPVPVSAPAHAAAGTPSSIPQAPSKESEVRPISPDPYAGREEEAAWPEEYYNEDEDEYPEEEEEDYEDDYRRGR